MAEIWLAHMISRPVGAGGAMPWYSQIWVDQLALLYQEAYYAHHHYWPPRILRPSYGHDRNRIESKNSSENNGVHFFHFIWTKTKKWKPLTNSILRSSLYEINWSWKICEKLPYILLYLAADQLSKELLLGIYIYKVHVFEPVCQPQSELVKKVGPTEPAEPGRVHGGNCPPPRFCLD
jgi:hypothetical protein